MKAEVEKADKNVYGVRAGANDIEVRLGSERTGGEIARSAVEAIKRHVLIPSEQSRVTVSHGRVTLEARSAGNFRESSRNPPSGEDRKED